MAIRGPVNLKHNAFLVEYVVRGVGAFPLDMLRYDCSYPADSRSAGCISQYGVGGSDMPYEVLLHHIGERGWRPTEGRWLSFGWAVV